MRLSAHPSGGLAPWLCLTHRGAKCLEEGARPYPSPAQRTGLSHRGRHWTTGKVLAAWVSPGGPHANWRSSTSATRGGWCSLHLCHAAPCSCKHIHIASRPFPAALGRLVTHVAPLKAAPSCSPPGSPPPGSPTPCTYNTQWGSRRPAGTASGRWAVGRGRGTPASPWCSSCQCPSLPSAARCRNSAASRSRHSRCCPTRAQLL